LALFLPALLRAQSALEIVEPANTSIVRPGEKLVLNVRTGIKYANLWLQGDRELNTFEMLNTTPYRFSVQIPPDIVAGLYRLWATGCRRPGDCDDLAPITINVEPIWPESTDGSPLVNDGAGVTVDTNGVPVAQRSAIIYPKEAIEKGIDGTMVVEVTPDWQGKVEGVQVLSGPVELRKDVVRAMLTWQFPTRAGRKPRQVEIKFDSIEANRALTLVSADQHFQRELPGSSTDLQRKDAEQARQPEGTRTTAQVTAGPTRIRVPAATQAAKLISKVDPIYPPLAKLNHFQGVVRFDAIIGNDGRVEIIQLVSGHPLLVEAAREAVKQWTYSPTLVNGSPVEVVTKIEVEFFLLN
jgi:TonB family protein